MEDHDRPRAIDLPLGAGILLTLGTSGCAKRPDVAIASAPAPTGAAATQQAPAPPPVAAQPAPVQPAPMLPAPASSQPAPVQPTPPPPAAAIVESAPPQVAAAPAPRPAPAEFMPHDALQPIHFDFDKSDIRPGDGNILQASARWLRENPGNLLLVEGHCDERGTTEYNAALGDPSLWQ